MERKNLRFLIFISIFTTIFVACQATENVSDLPATNTQIPTPTATNTPIPTLTATTIPSNPIKSDQINQDEPVYILGDIPYTSPFFLNSASEPFVLLEDQIGFIRRDLEHKFSPESQAIGPVEIHDDLRLTYGLALPSVPQGTYTDLDNNGLEDIGVQVFAVAYWSNTWGGPFLEERDGTGWSNAYASTITDPDNDHEIIGGTIIVWAPDDEQAFPSDFGTDGLLFTDDDPTGEITAGYTLVDLGQSPFIFYKETRPQISLIEGDLAVNNYSSQEYTDAFNAMFEKASTEYPFTNEKGVNWQVLYDKYSPLVADADNDEDFYRALRDLTYEIPDGHIGLTLNPDVFYREQAGSFGLNLVELSDGRVIVTNVHPGTPGERTGIEVGAEIISWDNQPVLNAINEIEPYFGPYSTEQTRRLAQADFLTRVIPGSSVDIVIKNPDQTEPIERTLIAEAEFDSLFQTIPSFNEDELALPIQGEVLDDSQLGYMRVITFSDDYHLMAQLWDSHIQALIDNEVPGLIIDLRSNSGGSSGLAYDFAGYFFDEEIQLYNSSYYNEQTGEFEYTDYPARVKPAPILYEGPIVVLIGPDCVSACEGFAYALTQNERAIVIGHYPSAGAFGEVGRGQYELPGDISMQFPTGRPETADGQLLIEGTGIVPDIIVPVTEESALGLIDTVLQAAIDELLDMLK